MGGIPESPRLLQQRQSRCLPTGQELRPCASSLGDLWVSGNEVVLVVEGQHVAGWLGHKKERATDREREEVIYNLLQGSECKWIETQAAGEA